MHVLLQVRWVVIKYENMFIKMKLSETVAKGKWLAKFLLQIWRSNSIDNCNTDLCIAFFHYTFMFGLQFVQSRRGDGERETIT